MIRLQKSEALQRKIRQDDVAELAIPTWTLVREAIQAGRVDEALEFIDYELTMSKAMHDNLIVFLNGFITKLASFDEEEVEKFFRERYYPKMKDWLVTTPGVEDFLQRWTEMHRGHFSDITVVDEPDRYVVRLDPCGSGGRLRRTIGVSTTKKAYPWSWSKVNVPLYCIHCCVSWEIIMTELRGYPAKVAFIGARPEDPCIHLFYKKPELIPEEYFARIGKTKTIK